MLNKLFYLLSKKHKTQLILLLFLMFIGMLFEMAGLGILVPLLSIIVDTNIENKAPLIKKIYLLFGNPSHFKFMIGALITLVVFYLIKTIYLAILGWIQSAFVSNLSANLADRLFLGYLNQPYSFHLQNNSAKLISNIQVEVTQFTLLTQSTMYFILELSTVIGVAFVLFLANPSGALSVTILLSLSAFSFHKFTKNYIKKLGTNRQIHTEKMNQHILQGLGGVKEIKLAGRQKYFFKEFHNHNNNLAKIVSKITTLNLLPRLYLELLAVIGLAVVIISMLIKHESINDVVPVLGVFVAAAFRMIPSIFRIMSSVQNIKYSEPVITILYKEIKLINHKTDLDLNTSEKLSFKNNIVLEKLNFTYPETNKKVLNDVSFEIKKGQSIGFIGISGSGKSTLIDLILGLLEPTSGQIKVDGNNIFNNLPIWQNQIGYVPQSIYLTDSTLRENIAFGIPLSEIDETAILKSIKLAQLESLIAELPFGLDTIVGERGVRLSGGQRQRIGIARALYKDPEVLVLDEATSALDNETELNVMMAIEELQGKITLLIIAHRISTISKCDYIYNLNNETLKNVNESPL